MQVRKVYAKRVKNSRGEWTISVTIKTIKGKFVTMAPSGKSTGKFEVPSYGEGGLMGDIKYINSIETSKLGILRINDLKRIERIVKDEIGGNSLYCLEASLLKALARKKGKELWQLLGGRKIPRPVGNAIGGGLHSRGIGGRRPDFQEFLFISDCKNVKDCILMNRRAYDIAQKLLKAKRRNDEGAWETGLCNKEVIGVIKMVTYMMKKKYGVYVRIGLDIAASSFFKKARYIYMNKRKILNKAEQVKYMVELIKLNELYYIEDPMHEYDFSGFSELLKNVKGEALIVGDDLTTTNPKRLRSAIKKNSINAIIIKPNQIGSLLKVKEVVDIAKKKGIKTIISHRSGETKDNTIADLGVGFNCDFIKTGIYGKVREAKLSRLVEIEKSLK